VASAQRLGRDPKLPSFFRPISLLDTVGQLFEKILLTGGLPRRNESTGCCGTSSSVFDPDIARRRIWPALLKILTKTA
jgi:hypothetical protein